CVAVVRKSNRDTGNPPGDSPKYHAVASSNAIDPPHGPKSVFGVASAPACPRELALSMNAAEPVAIDVPALDPARSGAVSVRPPAYTLIRFAATDVAGAVTTSPVAGSRTCPDQTFDPAGAIAARLSMIRSENV